MIRNTISIIITETHPHGILIYLQFLRDFFFQLFRYEILKDKAPAERFCFCSVFLFSNKLPGINTTRSGVWARLLREPHHHTQRSAHAMSSEEGKTYATHRHPTCRESPHCSAPCDIGLTHKPVRFASVHRSDIVFMSPMQVNSPCTLLFHKM